jgi:hypothetical protein
MVETIASLPQGMMHVFSGHSAERIEPILRIGPEALDAVEMVPSFGPTSPLKDHHIKRKSPRAIGQKPGNRSFGSSLFGRGH